MATFARRIASLANISSSRTFTQASSFSQRRGLSGAAEHGHGPAKVDCWKEPTNPGNWKEEHFVIVSLTGWGLLIYGSYKFFTGGKKEELVKAPQ